MTLHIHGTIVTHYAVAANNRGETEGNLTTLQKLLWKGETHSSVSAEAIRFAIRSYWQEQNELTGDERYVTNRYWVATSDGGDHAWRNPAFSEQDYIDDDLFGYMDAKAPAAEQHETPEETDEGAEAGSDKKKAKAPRPKGTTRARRGALEISRAISLDPYIGETSFNARGGKKGNTSLYATEVHATAYQYSFSLTPAYLTVPQRADLALNAIEALSAVGGNQSRYLFDFSPATALLRLTDDPASRILFALEGNTESGLNLQRLVGLVQSGDVDGKELIVGGEATRLEEIQMLRDNGVVVVPGIKQAFQLARERLSR